MRSSRTIALGRVMGNSIEVNVSVPRWRILRAQAAVRVAMVLAWLGLREPSLRLALWAARSVTEGVRLEAP